MRSSHKCDECGEAFVPRRSSARFCSTACRKAHNNRRAMRGAMLYDAFMALRYDRDGAAEAGLDYKTVCRIGELFNREDEQAGRPRAYSAKSFMYDHQSMVNARHGRV